LLKAGYNRAYNVALKRGYGLELMHEIPNPDVFVKEGVPEGVAWYFCNPEEIEIFWNENKRLRLDEDGDGFSN
jgi:hypothetical protein